MTEIDGDAAGGLDGRGRASGSARRSSTGTCPAAAQNEIYEIRRGDLHCALRIPPPTAPAETGRRDRPGVADHRGARRERRAAHRGGRASCEDRSVLGRTVLPDGVRGRLVADGPGGSWPARSTPTWRPAGPGVPADRGHRAAVAGGLAGPGTDGSRAAGRVPRAPGRPVDGLPGPDQGPGAARASTRRRRGCGAHKPIDFIPGIMHGDYQFANVMFRHGGAGPAGGAALTGRWARSATPSSTWPGSCSRGRRTPAAATGRLGGYVDLTGMPSRGRAAGALRGGVRPAGGRHRLLLRAGAVEARGRARADVPEVR